MKQQNTFWHEKIDPDKLKGYVYALVDPKESTVFYIGRAGGNEAQGNKRPDAHLKEAIEYRDNQSIVQKEKAKLERIIEIWNREDNNEVQLVILRRGLDFDTTVQLEAAFIQYFETFKKKDLKNNYAGFRDSIFGLVDSTNASELHATPIKSFKSDKDKKQLNLWIFPIKNNLAKGINPVEATLRAWNLKAFSHLLNPEKFINLAVGVDRNQISRSLIEFYKIEDDELPNKNKILGEDVSNDEKWKHFFERNYDQVLKKDLSQVKKESSGEYLGFWQRGNFLIVTVENNTLQYLRGNKKYNQITLPD